MKKPPHTTVRHNTLWARMYIPEELRVGCFDGQKMFLEKIGPWPMDYHQALAAAATYVAGWKKQIERARQAPDWVDDMVSHVGDQLAEDVLDIMNEDELRDTAKRFLTALKNKQPLVEAAQSILAPKGNTDFLTHFKDWQSKTHLKDKTLDQAVSDIKQFAAAVSQPLEALTGAHIQGWIETQLETISAATVRRKLSAVRSYWDWLQSHEIVSADRAPFTGRKVQDRRTKVERALDKRQRFELSEVVRLITAAEDDKPLQALIRLAAFTGGRREGLASLKTDLVVEIEGVKSLRLREKTEAGVRDVPIHPDIAGLVAKLMQDLEDGFLIQSEANRYGQRGDALGKRFTRLKTSLGFGEHHTLHSLRHTAVHLFRKAECPLEIRNQNSRP